MMLLVVEHMLLTVHRAIHTRLPAALKFSSHERDFAVIVNLLLRSTKHTDILLL